MAELRVILICPAVQLGSDLAATGKLHECYDDAGRGLWPERETFLSWSVLALDALS